MRARSIDPEVFDLPLAAPRRRAAGAAGRRSVRSHALLLDLPTLERRSRRSCTRVAVFADPWPGPVAIWRSGDGLSFERAALALAPSIVGETLDDLPAGPTSRHRIACNRVRVRLYGGALASVSDSALLGGANAAAVQRPDGAWEVLQFANAELVGERTYELSRLLRGQAGSEWAMARSACRPARRSCCSTSMWCRWRAGSTMLGRADAASHRRGRPRSWRSERGRRSTPRPSATALRPLSPVHLRATRGRLTACMFDLDPAHAAAGRILGARRGAARRGDRGLRARLLDGSDVVRTLATAQPTVLYAAADEIADFGAPQPSLSVRVAQLSATVGRGIAAAAVLQP